MIHMPPHPFSEKYPVRFMSLEKLLPRARLLVLTAALTEQPAGC